MTVILYILLIFAWGSSWIAINWQISDVSPVVSIFYRFALAAIIMFPISYLSGKLQATTKKDHLYFLMQGCFLFSCNFICFYYASHYLVSGLIAVIFSLAIIFNIFNSYVFFGERPKTSAKIGALLGICGLILVFWQQLMATTIDEGLLLGVGLSFLGVYVFSLGNMISVRHGRVGVRPITSTNYAIFYGSLILLAICFINGEKFSFEYSYKYVGSWLFLAIIATIFGFTAYLSLVVKTGASRAAYILVITPIVALIFSSIFESYTWSIGAMTGVGFIIVGNIVGLKR